MPHEGVDLTEAYILGLSLPCTPPLDLLSPTPLVGCPFGPVPQQLQSIQE